MSAASISPLSLTSKLLGAFIATTVSTSAFARETLTTQSDRQAIVSVEQILKNISFTRDTLHGQPGAMVASPGSAFDNVNHANQDYQFHWTRDAALVMREVLSAYIRATDASAKANLKKLMFDYANFSKSNQSANAEAGLGEPKFYVDGRPYDREWGRPQTDGPALRAMTLASFAEQLIAEGDIEKAKELFAIVKTDLDYVAIIHTETTFDIWEEVRAIHFATLNYQQAALRQGLRLAHELDITDDGEQKWWREELDKILLRRRDFWSDSKGIIEASQDFFKGYNKDKHSHLDMAVIMSVLTVKDSNLSFDSRDIGASHSWVLSTAEKIRRQFTDIYEVNKGRGFFAGRYAEDTYFGGNPWALTTFAFAELYFQTAQEFLNAGELKVDNLNRDFLFRVLPPRDQYIVSENQILRANDSKFHEVIKNLVREGDTILDAIEAKIPANGEISEQLSKVDGRAAALPNLTWSHAAYLHVYSVRKHLSLQLKTCAELLTH